MVGTQQAAGGVKIDTQQSTGGPIASIQQAAGGPIVSTQQAAGELRARIGFPQELDVLVLLGAPPNLPGDGGGGVRGQQKRAQSGMVAWFLLLFPFLKPPLLT